MKNDTIRVTITEDGLCKLDTDRISLPNHRTAESLVRGIAEVAGGSTSSKSKHKHGHSHVHEHTHGEEHHEH